MFRQYIKQAWELMKQNRFYSAVYIIGTGMTITLVMVIAMVFHIRTGNIAPETKRDRMLIAERAKAVNENGGQRYSGLSYQTLKECFYTLETPEIVTGVVPGFAMNQYFGDFYMNLPGNEELQLPYLMGVDDAYWKVFDFHFIHGEPFTFEEFSSGINKVILSESLARSLFGRPDIPGQTVMLNDLEYVVAGVVKDVSSSMRMTYADAWVLYSSFPLLIETGRTDDIVGSFESYILKKNRADVLRIQEEFTKQVARYNEMLMEWKYDPEPLQTVTHLVFSKMDWRSSYKENRMKVILLFLLLMLVPALNLSGLTSSRMQDRIVEMGIRKAFGAKQLTLIMQVLTENLLLTFMGGIAGLLFSCLIIYLSAETLLSQSSWYDVPREVTLSVGMLFNVTIFLFTFLACIILNFFSSIIPVWKVSGISVVQSINDNLN